MHVALPIAGQTDDGLVLVVETQDDGGDVAVLHRPAEDPIDLFVIEVPHRQHERVDQQFYDSRMRPVHAPQ